MPGKTGTIAFTLKPIEIPDDAGLFQIAKFGNGSTLDIALFRNADRNMEVRVAFEHVFHTFTGPMPSIPPKGLPMAVSWDEASITLWVNGQKVSVAAVSPSIH